MEFLWNIKDYYFFPTAEKSNQKKPPLWKYFGCNLKLSKIFKLIPIFSLQNVRTQTVNMFNDNFLIHLYQNISNAENKNEPRRGDMIIDND